MGDIAFIIAGQLREKREARAAEAAAAAVVVAEPVTEPVVDASAEEAKAKPVTFKAAYVSDDGVICLIGAYAGNVDLDEDMLETDALKAMAYDFCAAEKRVFNANHGKEELKADLVASMPGAPILKSGRVLAFGEDIPDDDPITGIDLKAEPICWVFYVRPHDPEIVEKAKAGGIAGASWGALITREEF